MKNKFVTGRSCKKCFEFSGKQVSISKTKMGAYKVISGNTAFLQVFVVGYNFGMPSKVTFKQELHCSHVNLLFETDSSTCQKHNIEYKYFLEVISSVKGFTVPEKTPRP